MKRIFAFFLSLLLILRFGRGMPLHPRKLTVPLRDDDIAHAVGAALDGKGHSGGAIRVDLRTGIERPQPGGKVLRRMERVVGTVAPVLGVAQHRR